MSIHLTLARPDRRLARRWITCLALAFGLGLALGLLPSGRVARACSCVTPPPPPQALQAAAAVFDGTVTRVEVADPQGSFSPLRVTFVIHTQWKGVTSGTIDVTTAGDSAMCGYSFQLGKRYIVYVAGGLDGTEVSLCSRTRLYDADEAAALGPDNPPAGAVPAAAWQQEPPSVGCPRCMAPPPPRQALAEAAAVFHGQLVGLTFMGPDHAFDHVATFRNLGWWKGPAAPTIDVRVPWNVWFCEGQFGGVGGVREWGEYLVYAGADDDGTLSLALCGRTKAYDADEAAELGAPNPPGPEQPTGTPSRHRHAHRRATGHRHARPLPHPRVPALRRSAAGQGVAGRVRRGVPRPGHADRAGGLRSPCLLHRRRGVEGAA